jgi:hypothetical protein
MSRVHSAKFVHWRFVRMRPILDEPAKLTSGRPPCPVRSNPKDKPCSSIKDEFVWHHSTSDSGGKRDLRVSSGSRRYREAPLERRTMKVQTGASRSNPYEHSW